MTLSFKRREVKETAPKLKVVNRPIADETTPPALTSTTTPAGIAANDPSAAGLWQGLKDAIKQTMLKRWLAEHTYVPMGLPTDDPIIASSLVKNRMYGIWLRGDAFDVFGGEKGLQFMRDGKVLSTWAYDEVTLAILSSAGAAAPPAKSGRKKAAAPAALTPPARELMKTLSTGEMLDVKKLKRHPLNRQPTDADVKARAESLQADGQLEDIVVRMTEGGWQIVSGETRFLAAKQLGWTQLRCTVIDCDDNEALRLVGLFNGQRSNLTPIQKAQHIKLMCAQGMTREEAARSVGLESHSAASNLVKLLELPQVWQERVTSGELAETFARSIAAYANVPGLLAELDEIWINGDDWERKETFGSRDDLDESIQHILGKVTRPMKGERYYDWGCFEGMGNTRPTGNYKVLITPAELEAHREQLGIVTIALKEKQRKSGGKFTWKSEDVEVATNAALFDKLQIAHIVELSKKKAQGKAQAAGASADAGETSEQKKFKAGERTRQLTRAISEWKRGVMRNEIAGAIRAVKVGAKFDQRLLVLVLSFMTRPGSFDSSHVCPPLGRALGKKLDSWKPTYPAVATITTADKWQEVARDICAHLVGGDDKERGAAIDDDVLESLFDTWGGSMEASWTRLYCHADPLIEEFFQLHRKNELVHLAKEIEGLTFAEETGKAEMVTKLMGQRLRANHKLPKSLQPSKGKRGGK
jgi:ParB/RepB/Spo0J family partition protein